MKKLLILSLGVLILSSSVLFAQKPSYTAYIKPAFKGLAALACFYSSYKTGQFTYYSGKMAYDIVQDDDSHKLSIATPFNLAGFVFGVSVMVPSSIASVSTGILGGILAKSSYNDVKKILKQN